MWKARRMLRFAAGTASYSAALAAIGFFVVANEGAAQPVLDLQVDSAQPAFEVASVRPLLQVPDPQFRVEHGNLNARMGLTWLISWAYGVPYHQVVAPAWARVAGMAIAAKATSPVGEDQVRLMLRNLLADRFKLRVHPESRETRVLALMVNKNVSRLKASESEGSWKREFDDDALREIFTGITMAEFAGFLAQYFNGCLDRTGLTGRYDFALNYKGLVDPEKSVVLEVVRSRSEALDQLGLKLQLIKAPLDFVVVDHLERVPTDN